ncbi:HD domain-containing protein [Asticcacaulis machinosus]|uniref:HD domain-containing protein n=1 Tax=Asticcacaulis machinosus TaxID=2984211 RepID=A0ABT5HEL4_9CAUL|nr:HD domain-containing protein [Asticcacaulis machinosus]MDC7674575.1 HD domain-containing protein [Asticcacaulis machinosus]
MSFVQLSEAFAPFEDLAQDLLPHVVMTNDGAHDAAHLIRVYKLAKSLQALEGGCLRVLTAAVLLHDCVAVEKNSPERSRASRLAADKAREILTRLGWDEADLDAVDHAIHAHSYSANIPPQTLEAKILQDADRLDALGFVGIARCFYTAGRMGSSLYDAADPVAKERDLDDASFALDHFTTKLLKLTDGFKTKAGKDMAELRHARMQAFIEYFVEEI